MTRGEQKVLDLLAEDNFRTLRLSFVHTVAAILSKETGKEVTVEPAHYGRDGALWLVVEGGDTPEMRRMADAVWAGAENTMSLLKKVRAEFDKEERHEQMVELHANAKHHQASEAK